MLKIYKAFYSSGSDNIVLNDYIDFRNGYYFSGPHGFGNAIGNIDCKRANLVYQNLESYERYLKNVKKIDGFVEDLMIYFPMDYETMLEKFKDIPQNYESYEKYCLNEEAILLFTSFVSLQTENEELAKLMIGRPEMGGCRTAIYILKPGAVVNMSRTQSDENIETFEVLQSQSKCLRKQLFLQKLNK